ncbi:hypothetical protein B566_EDAN014542 [Ephemera danica]|nr:hypothetical protein B566_EDAN014542 [Ephemera danica]
MSFRRFFGVVSRMFDKNICTSMHSCYSIALPLVLYAGLFLLVWTLHIPLKSNYNSKIHHKLSDMLQVERKVHLDAVRLQRDGDINKQYHKEVILGEDEINTAEPEKLIEEIFHKADTDGNGLLSLKELVNWININIQQHINQAMKENFVLFSQIDNDPKNGLISWQEYHHYFLQKKGINESYVKNHDKKHKGLVRSIKEAIMRDRAAWSEAARSDPDNLNLDEFLAFRHPESSHATIITLVDELIDKFDRDGDETLTETEFASLRSDDETEQIREELTQGEAERRREFREIIDKNGDGRADRKELLMYIDPRNPRHARDEAETLVVLSDKDKDGNLSLAEILNKMDLFLGSKMVNAAKSFHDEF